MNKLPPLTSRLKLCADLVRDGVSIADIGTDHAYLPCYLVKIGKCISAVASDIKIGPLEKAEETLNVYGVKDKVRLNLGAGLNGILPDECDDIIIAGMGGENIAAMLSESEWICDPSKRLILQPMTSISDLRRFLCLNGFNIISEFVAVEGKRYYVVIHSDYNGNSFEPSEAFCEIGKLPEKLDDDRVRSYLELLIDKYNKIIIASQKSRKDVDTKRIEKLASYIKGLVSR